VRAKVRAARTAGLPAPDPPAARLPVARVALDVPQAHLDRPFDYAVTASQSEAARPGVRVRVRFAGREVGGLLLERTEASAHPGTLTALRRVVSPEPVLSAEVAALARAVADRYAGTLADVLRLAVPPRHARVEREPPAPAPGPPGAPPDAGPWVRYTAGPAFLAAVARGDAPAGVWAALPGEPWTTAVAYAAWTALAADRGTLVVVPDGRDVDRLAAALTSAVGPERVVALTADLGPAERYRRWIRVRRGGALAVVGTRAAMFAPVGRLGLVVCWDDGDDLHAEPRAPYPHVREVLALRARGQGAAALFGGHAMTAEAALMVESGWAHPLQAGRDLVRAAMPRVLVLGADDELARDPAAAGARLPTRAWQAARTALADGPVLVQVPRRGYLPALACQDCRAPARCGACGGPLGFGTARQEAPTCRWCTRASRDWRCPTCDGRRLRAQVVGAGRTAEELGRAFPGVPVHRSAGDAVLAAVGAGPALVVATPGAEPVAPDGYAAALLLDGWALTGRADLRAGEEALRRWMAAAALVRPGGVVALSAESSLAPVQALLRWDPATAAQRELAGRRALGLPPAVRMAAVTGGHETVQRLDRAALPPSAGVLGPVPGDEPGTSRLLVRVPLEHAGSLLAALTALRAGASARKVTDPPRVVVDPLDIG
jgi:primosomal protein N' (replication factor Y)